MAPNPADAELEHLLNVISHDLQAPLRSVRGFAGLLSARLGKEIDEETRRCVQHVVDGADRMQSLLDDLVTYSRVESRGNPMIPMDLDETLEWVLEDLATLVARSEAEINIEGLPRVVADREQVATVLRHVLRNALQFSVGRPRICVSGDRVGNRCVLTISDEGIGIAKRDHEKVFQVFSRLHTREEVPGNGIGLPLVKRIVERHGGSISLESEPGKGTVVRIALVAS